MITLLLSGIAIAKGHAQFTKNLKYGVGVGPNLSTLSGDSQGDNSYVPGVTAGFYTQKPLDNGVILETGLYYANVGSKSTSQFYDEVTFEEREQKERYTLSYLNVPFVARYHVSENVSVFAGPQISFLVGAKKKVEYGDEKDKRNAKDEFKTAAVSLSVGASYEFSSGDRVQLTVNPGLSNNTKSEGDYPGYGGNKGRVNALIIAWFCPLFGGAE
ncbi:porin family protein [Fulvivirgaceae bacterium BMA12]|uniref:Porin family protein n=1 Tax=Agaribacillus aureus TaxID=3051825 RepID=A0ABT8LCA9_9BACT|nr:porin family protein [Fulvivirgaceae bacterium BMA12]